MHRELRAARGAGHRAAASPRRRGRRAGHAVTELAPSEYLQRLYFDSLVYSPGGLEALVAAAGADRVLLGTDFPFDMGIEDPLARLEAAVGLTAEQRAAIAGGTAARLLGIERSADYSPASGGAL